MTNSFKQKTWNKLNSKLLFKSFLFSLVIIAIGVLFISLYYLNKANYYGDIEIVSNDQIEYKNIQIRGFSPFGNMLESIDDVDLYRYYYKRYYNHIEFKNCTDSLIELKLILDNGAFYKTILLEPNNEFNYKFDDIPRKGIIINAKFFIGFVIEKPASKFIICILFIAFLFAMVIRYWNLIYRKAKLVINVSNVPIKSLYLRSLLLTLITVGFGSIYLNVTGVLKQYPLDNQVNVRLVPDQADYQSIAVNFAIKNIFRINGMLDSTVNYKINIANEKSETNYLADKNRLKYVGGFNCYHRFPAYPLFVGVIYKFVGVNPIIIKLIQLFLLIVTLIFIPVFAYSVWGVRGFWAGVISQLVFYVYAYPSVVLISQDLITICINVFILWLFLKFRKNKSLKIAILLGVTLGISFLIKSSLMFFILFMFGFFALIIIRNKDNILLKNTTIAGLVFVLIWLPFNIIALINFNSDRENSIKLIDDIQKITDYNTINNNLIKNYYGETIKSYLYPLSEDEIDEYLTSLYDEVFRYKTYNQLQIQNYSYKSIMLAHIQMHSEHPKLFFLIALYPINTGLDLHNEYVTDGKQHPEWRYKPDSYYNKDDNIENVFPKSAIEFYKNYPKMLFKIAYSKFEAIFNGILIFKMFAIILSIFVMTQIILYRKFKSGLVMFTAAFLNLLFFFLVSSTVAVILSLILLIIMKLFYKKLKLIYIPVEFIWLIISMLLFTFITFAVERYVFYYYLPVVLITVFCFVAIINNSYKCLFKNLFGNRLLLKL
jgi:4-amino-4-deoxy-L-arabinose transferase-like glycosyltransferase